MPQLALGIYQRKNPDGSYTRFGINQMTSEDIKEVVRKFVSAAKHRNTGNYQEKTDREKNKGRCKGMALDINNFLADIFLELCKKKEYKDITVKDIRERSGISRTGFYNHFRDKNDLAQWIYYERIQTNFQKENMNTVVSYYEALVGYYQRVQKYHFFLKSALKDTGQNCLKDYMFEHPYEWELQYHLRWYEENTGKEPEMEKLSFFTEYHSSGAVSMTIKWIQRDMPIPPEEMARRITYLKRVGLSKILNDTEASHRHPYD